MSDPRVPCPYCAEPILAEATKCKHCGEWLDERALDRSSGVTVVDARKHDNALPALASFFAPGLGQLLQGRVLPALAFFATAGLCWLVTIASFGLLFFVGPLANIWAAVDAARWIVSDPVD